MKVLVIGGGGREHALVWKLANDRSRPDVFCAPGNAGTCGLAANVGVAAEDAGAVVDWSKRNRPDLVVVGPEAPLCAGLADALSAEGILVFGPSRAGAQIEGSKAFAKEIMQSAGVPTGKARSFDDAASALDYLKEAGLPVVIKADGLAAGKGVTVCGAASEARAAVEDAMVRRVFGEAGGKVLVEECLVGEEASIIGLVDGKRVVLLATAQDHKRVFNNDEGPNTGGMGAYSPTPAVSDALLSSLREDVFERVLAEFKRRGIVYRGALYAGIMLTESGPKVLEFNCRFGDPETQAILPRMKSDLSAALRACAEGSLDEKMIEWKPDPCVCVVMAAGGYPGSYKKGDAIEGMAEAEKAGGVTVFHAGTRLDGGRVVTSGGRVLGVTALGGDMKDSIRRAYMAVSRIRFDQAQYRTDIGARAVRRLDAGRAV